MSFKAISSRALEKDGECQTTACQIIKHKQRVDRKRSVFHKFSITTNFAARPDGPSNPTYYQKRRRPIAIHIEEKINQPPRSIVWVPLPIPPSPKAVTQLHRFKRPLQKSLKGSKAQRFRFSLCQNRYTNSIKTRSSLDAPAPTPSAPITPPSISNITLTGRGFQSSCHTVLIRGGPFRLSNFLGQGLSPLRKSRERVGCRIRTLFWNKNSDSEKPTDYTTTFWRGAGGKLKEREREEWIEERLAVQHLL